MNKIINLLQEDIGPRRNDFACIDCKHSHWYTGCKDQTIETNANLKNLFDEVVEKSKYSPQDFLKIACDEVEANIKLSYDQRDQGFKSTTTFDSFLKKFAQDDRERIAFQLIEKYKEKVKLGPQLVSETEVLICYCKVLYMETFHTSTDKKQYFHMTACEAKPGMLKDEGEE